MYSRKEWRYMEHLKSLSRDDYGHMWAATNHLNGFLTHLPWWTKDQKLEKTCLLYQVDSKGQLFLLCIMHVRRIRTSAHTMHILYTTDARHARLLCYRVPKWRWDRVGLMSISSFGDVRGPPMLQPQQSAPKTVSTSRSEVDEKIKDT